MKSNKYLYIFTFCFGLVQSATFSSNFTLGYDSNALKYSISEEVLSSNYIGFSSSLNTKAKIFKKNARFSFSFKNKFYDNTEKKSNYSLAFKLKQSLGQYQFLTFSYSYIDDIYLRMYTDVDQGILDYIYTGTDCYFDYSIVKLDYESPYIVNNKRKIKFNLNYIYETQFYNQFFTEFDLKLQGVGVKYLNFNKRNKYSVSFQNISADNLTLNDISLSTSYMDRGYDEFRVKTYFEHKFNKFNKIGFTINYNKREYTSILDEDQLHIERTHEDIQFLIEYYYKIGDLKNKVSFKNRNRTTTSPYGWVEDIKTFEVYSINYTIYFKKVEFN